MTSTFIRPDVDYFAILGLAPDAGSDDVGRAWRRLVLIHHPDKSTASSTAHGAASVDIHVVNEARAVLSSPDARAAYLSARAAHLAHATGRDDAGPAFAAGPRLREHVSLSDFTPHYGAPDAPSVARADTGTAPDMLEPEPTHYTLPCRCGHHYVITHAQLEEGVDVVGCDGCGEWIGVLYKAVDEEDAEEVAGDGDGAEKQ
ncbi:hypothetical protein Q5752_005357 [Cryptotrichosporon argae]